METKRSSFRFSESTLKDLDFLAYSRGQSRTAVLEDLIFSAADSLRGNPALNEIMKKMKELSETLSNMNAPVQFSGTEINRE